GRKASTTVVSVRLLSKLLRDKDLGRLVVPIVPDEARTFGMEALFRQVGIYSHAGQMYEPVDMDTLLYYKEASDGQILEEGITEAGSMSSFIAADTAYATHGVNTIPFFIYYSMFGFQRVGDLIWAAANAPLRAQLFGSGAILPEVIKAQEVLESKYDVASDVWSVTSYTELYREGHACERWNMLHPSETPRVPYVTQSLANAPGVLIAASDYVKALP